MSADMTPEGRVQVIAALALEALDLAIDHGVEECEDGCSVDAARILARLKDLAQLTAVIP